MATSNLFLDSLSPDARDALLAHCISVELPLRAVLYQSQLEPRYAYLPTSGIASVVASGPNGEAIEVEIIGREGVIGANHLLGPALAPTQCFMQLPGTVLRIRFADLQRLFLDSLEIRTRMLEFLQMSLFTMGQIAGCHRMHTAEQRLARWLLMVQDRVQLEALELTQEYLAEMLGSQRTTVSAVASAFQKKGLIQYTRGRLRILDTAGLEKAACGCYPIVRDLLARLYQQVSAGDGLYSSSSIVSR